MLLGNNGGVPPLSPEQTFPLSFGSLEHVSSFGLSFLHHSPHIVLERGPLTTIGVREARISRRAPCHSNPKWFETWVFSGMLYKIATAQTTTGIQHFPPIYVFVPKYFSRFSAIFFWLVAIVFFSPSLFCLSHRYPFFKAGCLDGR